MEEVSGFHNFHKGKTALLVGNGENLVKTPPEAFAFLSFGMNTCHKWQGGWMPDFYIAVDQRLMREFGDDIAEKYADTPKFIPRPNLNKWKGEGFYRFLHRPGLIISDGTKASDRNSLTETGITYTNVMHVALQLAWYMGFVTVLMIGVHHKPFKAQNHFWGCDHGMTATPPLDIWFDGYSKIVQAMSNDGVKVLNISEGTYLPNEIIPQDNWMNWSSKNEYQNA